MEPGYVKLDVDTMTFEEVMRGLRYNYLKGTSEVIAEIDKRIFERAYKFAKEKEASCHKKNIKSVTDEEKVENYIVELEEENEN